MCRRSPGGAALGDPSTGGKLVFLASTDISVLLTASNRCDMDTWGKGHSLRHLPYPATSPALFASYSQNRGKKYLSYPSMDPCLKYSEPNIQSSSWRSIQGQHFHSHFSRKLFVFFYFYLMSFFCTVTRHQLLGRSFESHGAPFKINANQGSEAMQVVAFWSSALNSIDGKSRSTIDLHPLACPCWSITPPFVNPHPLLLSSARLTHTLLTTTTNKADGQQCQVTITYQLCSRPICIDLPNRKMTYSDLLDDT